MIMIIKFRLNPMRVRNPLPLRLVARPEVCVHRKESRDENLLPVRTSCPCALRLKNSSRLQGLQNEVWRGHLGATSPLAMRLLSRVSAPVSSPLCSSHVRRIRSASAEIKECNELRTGNISATYPKRLSPEPRGLRGDEAARRYMVTRLLNSTLLQIERRKTFEKRISYHKNFIRHDIFNMMNTSNILDL